MDRNTCILKCFTISKLTFFGLRSPC